MTSRRGILIAIHRRVTGDSNEQGAALISAILFIVLLSGLSVLMLGVLLGQAGPALVSQKRAQTGYAAQAGIQATLNTIRSIDRTSPQGVFGDRSKLPCTVAGRVDGSSDALQYQVEVQYFSVDPSYQNDAWRSSHDLTCTGAGGVSPQPSFAYIESWGVGEDLINQTEGTGDRGVGAVYAFKLSNINIPGGLMLSSANGFCIRASSVAVGAILNFRTKATCTVPETDYFVYTENIQFRLASSVSTATPNGLCITQGAPNGADSPLTLQTCRPIPDANRWNQLWSIDGGTQFWGQKNPISSGRSNICLSHKNLFAGGRVTASTASCNGWEPEFKVGSGAANHSTWQAVSFGEFGRCMDVTEGNVNFSYMIVWPCKQDPTGTGSALNWNHKFYYTEPDGLQGSQTTTIMTHTVNLPTTAIPSPSSSQTRCLQTPANTTSSTYPIFVSCNGSARQQWTRTAASTTGYANSWLFTDTYGRCVTAMNTDLYNNWISKIGVVGCTGSTLQKWNAPPYTTEATVGGFKELSG
ncbi:MAG: hypothetical protein ACOH1J_04600 [Microbacteriaceae bacterium]